ncbi:hypothetical protein WJX73_003936 [Symbiochloris irregularis]|uniref:Uncharacterized protein n=1 Tax=Symbiochloris irregularis TaxID=706552 RepID=A0AAW1PRX3_9CHLO
MLSRFHSLALKASLYLSHSLGCGVIITGTDALTGSLSRRRGMLLAPDLEPPVYEHLTNQLQEDDLLQLEQQLQRQKLEVQNHMKDTLPLGATRTQGQQPVEDLAEAEVGDTDDDDAEGSEDEDDEEEEDEDEELESDTDRPMIRTEFMTPDF